MSRGLIPRLPASIAGPDPVFPRLCRQSRASLWRSWKGDPIQPLASLGLYLLPGVLPPTAGRTIHTSLVPADNGDSTPAHAETRTPPWADPRRTSEKARG